MVCRECGSGVGVCRVRLSGVGVSGVWECDAVGWCVCAGCVSAVSVGPVGRETFVFLSYPLPTVGCVLPLVDRSALWVCIWLGLVIFFERFST